MKNLKYFIALLSFVFIACQEDKDPVGYVANTFKITSPSSGISITTNPNQASATAFTLTWSPVDFGYNAAVKYSLEIYYGSAFKTVSLGNYNEYSGAEHSYQMSYKQLNTTLFSLLSEQIATNTTFLMRIKATPDMQSTSANALVSYTDYVSFNSNVYNTADDHTRLYVFGNFGAASTYADWDINTTGTSNSPTIYSINDDGKYEGFVYMNVSSPQFKLAAPDATNLNIKGVGTQFGFTNFTAVSADNYLGTSTSGTLQTSTDISTGNVITPFVAGPSTYYIRADWKANKYAIAKRVVILKGTMTGLTSPNVILTYETNPASPYYRKYVNYNANLISSGQALIQFVTGFAIGDRLEIMGFDGVANTLLNVAPNSTSQITNKMKMTGSPFKIQQSGNYTVVLDLSNSVNYNLKFILN